MEPKKPPEREQTTIRLPAELKEALQREAEQRGRSLNGYLLSMIESGRKNQSLLEGKTISPCSDS